MGKADLTHDKPPAAGTTIEDVKTTLRELIEENAGIPADTLRDDSSIDGDLAMDSFSMLSVQVAVEEAFEVPFELSDLEACGRFDAIAALISERVEAKTNSSPPSRQGTKKRRAKGS